MMLLAGCTHSASPCGDVACGACPPPITLTVITSDGSTPTVRGDAELACSTTGDTTTCSAVSDLPPGHYAFTVTTPAGESKAVDVTLAPGATGCCGCTVDAVMPEVRFDGSDAGPSSADGGL